MRKKVLIALYTINCLFILSLWGRSSFGLLTSGNFASVLLALGRLFGLISVVCVLTQLLLIGRIKWIERVWGHDSLAKLHRKNGELILFTLLIHFTLILTSYSVFSRVNVLRQLFTFFESYEDALNAFLGFCLFVTIAIFSIFISKLKLKYETWYFTHLLMYLAILLSYGHQLVLGGTLTEQIVGMYWNGMYIFVISNFVFFRFFTPVAHLAIYRFHISKIVKEEGNATSVYITGRHMERLSRESGQFMIVRFLDLKRFWQAHPFSLSWNEKNSDLRLTIKDSGDFTHEISSLKVGTPVLVDGPHGKFTVEKETSKKLLLIAGGIGITPILSILESEAGARDIVFFWSNKKRGEVPLFNEVTNVVKNHSIPSFLFYTEEKNKKSGEYLGHIEKDSLSELVKDVKEREVFLCGPEAFMYALRDSLVSLGVPSNKIHFEVFSFHS